MSNHTPEPWKAVYVGCSDWDLIGPVTEQDWKLAAAAPDLLEALQDALQLIDAITPIEGETVRSARRAIAKATGGQP